MTLIRFVLILTLCLSSVGAVQFQGHLSNEFRIESRALGYAVPYRVYLPERSVEGSKFPVVYVIDGRWYLEQGRMRGELDKLISGGKLENVVAVFLGSGSADVPDENHRAEQFACDAQFVRFFAGELVPEIENTFPVSPKPHDRLVTGVATGGVDAACFGMMLPTVFPNIGMHSPASGEQIELVRSQYEAVAMQPLKVFLSSGDSTDSRSASRRFRKALERQGHEVTWVEAGQGQGRDNWPTLIDDLLLTFFARKTDNEAPRKGASGSG